MRRRMAIALGLFVVLVFASFVVAANEDEDDEIEKEYKVPLTGDQEVPSVDTEASGYAEVEVKWKGDYTLVKFEVEVCAISDVTMAHIHYGPVGENGPILFTLFSADGSPFSADDCEALSKGELSADDLNPNQDAIADWESFVEVYLAGETYVNVHTEAYPGGELRGQLAEEEDGGEEVVPSIAITSPPDGSQVSTLGFRLTVTVSDFTLDAAAMGGANVAGTGHIHYSLDGALVGGGMTAATTIDVTGLEVGEHTVRAELVNNDHSPLDPAVYAEITVTAIAPSITLTLSATSIEEGSTVVASWTVTGFALDAAAIGGANVPGRGHVRVLVDGEVITRTAASSITLEALAVGSHTVRVELSNNDRSAVSPAVFDEATLEVTAAEGPVPAAGITDLGWIILVLLLVIAIASAVTALVLRRRRARQP